MLDRDEFRELEPHADGICALHVPSTGIVDYRDVASKYAELIDRAGGEIILRARVIGLCDDPDANIVETSAGVYRASHVINRAGLYRTPSRAWRDVGSISRLSPSAGSTTS